MMTPQQIADKLSQDLVVQLFAYPVIAREGEEIRAEKYFQNAMKVFEAQGINIREFLNQSTPESEEVWKIITRKHFGEEALSMVESRNTPYQLGYLRHVRMTVAQFLLTVTQDDFKGWKTDGLKDKIDSLSQGRTTLVTWSEFRPGEKFLTIDDYAELINKQLEILVGDQLKPKLYTPLTFALIVPYESISTQALLAFGADPNQIDGRGMHPLAYYDEESVNSVNQRKLLIAHGANPNFLAPQRISVGSGLLYVGPVTNPVRFTQPPAPVQMPDPAPQPEEERPGACLIL
jgi:hypothetical protein